MPEIVKVKSNMKEQDNGGGHRWMILRQKDAGHILSCYPTNVGSQHGDRYSHSVEHSVSEVEKGIGQIKT